MVAIARSASSQMIRMVAIYQLPENYSHVLHRHSMYPVCDKYQSGFHMLLNRAFDTVFRMFVSTYHLLLFSSGKRKRDKGQHEFSHYSYRENHNSAK